MSFTLNGFAVLAGTISFPRQGAWYAVIDVDTPLVQSGVALIVADGLSLRGTIVHGSENGGRITYRIVGGSGGFDKTVAGQDYSPTQLRLLVVDLLTRIGEVLSPTADAVTLDRPVARWSRTESIASPALSLLLDRIAPGVVWRLLDDGTVWIGPELWLPRVMLYEVNDDPAGARRLVISGETPWMVRPGESLDLRKVERVEVEIAAVKVRVVVWYLDGKGPDLLLDRVGGLIDRLVQRAMRRVDYFASYACRVIAQVAGGKLELKADDKRIVGLSQVPIRGLPGVEVKVVPGARCFVSWDGGDPSKPYAHDFEPSSLLELAITATAKVTVTAPDVRLGGTAAVDPVVRLSDLAATVAGLAATFATHVHPGKPATLPGEVTAVPVGALAATPTGSAIVKSV